MVDEKKTIESKGEADAPADAEIVGIRKRLMSTTSFHSLQSERNIISVLKKLGWDTTHCLPRLFQ